ncbi:MAG: two-component system, NarL family, sensor kinase [Actinomycetota bacterium]
MTAVVVAIARTPAAEIRDVAPSSLAVWVTLCALANVLPVPSAPNVYLSMSSPVNIAIAVLFPPGVAGALVASSSISGWEVRRETTVLHALYNRAQLGVSAVAAGVAVRAFGDDVTIAGAAAAVVAYHACNWLLVIAAETTCRGTPLRKATRGLLPPGFVAPLSYLTLGLMGVALAATYRDVGSWAVALLMLPMLGARYAVATSIKLEQAQRSQQMLANRLIDERERERVRIAAEIHDVVLQDLAGVQIMSGNVRSAIDVRDDSLAKQLAQQLEVAARDAVTSLRGAINNLRRSAVDEAGIVATLARYARTFSMQSGISVDFTTDRVTTLPSSVGLLVYESCQEALRNVSRHADATCAQVSLRRAGTNVELVVRDDGVGMERSRRSRASSDAGSGVGLRLLHDKIELAGGTLMINAPNDGGTEIVISIPLEDGADMGVLEP